MSANKYLFASLLCSMFFISGCAETANRFTVEPQTRDLFDSDIDGVINARDNCMKTPEGAVIDNDGCSLEYKLMEEVATVIMFGFDQDTLSPTQIGNIKARIAELLQKQRPQLYLIGDTSPEGSDNYNHQLAQRRADEVTRIVVEAGFPREQIIEQVYYSGNVIPKPLAGRQHRLVAIATWQEQGVEMLWNIFTTQDQILYPQ